MKVLILLALVVASNAAAVAYHPAGLLAGSTYRARDGLGNYAYGYQNANVGYPSFHSESGDASGSKRGSYGLRSLDGKVKVVEYVADELGYRANVRTSGEVPMGHRDAAGVSTSEIKPAHGYAYQHPFSYQGFPHYAPA